MLPSPVLLIALSWVYMVFGQTPAVAGVLWGIKPAVTAIVLAAAWRIGKRALTNRVLWAIAAAAFVAIYALALPFPLIVLGAALTGALGARWAPRYFRAGGGHAAGKAAPLPAVIDDATPTPPHARFSRARLLRQLAVGLGLWAVAIGGLAAFGGLHGTLTQMAAFFTKAALSTLGGACAVLPYVAQAAVGHYGWLTAAQMIDGLAFGETARRLRGTVRPGIGGDRHRR